ncbi:hypothetical protein [Erythrobacter sp. SG61-1L]|uniref:hypothetical protein n=1 Tax=Erythrobacter sp. SG61-1L TaxID=1603897 RepID=UPI0012E17F05|nr:hypothetical protein [Erythrobacter sp. SG61-1L]
MPIPWEGMFRKGIRKKGGKLVIGAYLCRTFGHRVNRRRVWNDGIDFRTSCHRCGTELIRDLDQWREYDPARHDNPGRLPHPRARDPG